MCVDTLLLWIGTSHERDTLLPCDMNSQSMEMTGTLNSVIQGTLLLLLFTALAGAASDQLCKDVFGKCQRRCTRVGYSVTGLCGGPDGLLCCIPEFEDKYCRQSFGECRNTLLPDQCRGRFLSGLCNGPSYRQCCIPI